MLELRKNKVMFYLSILVVVLSIAFHILNRGFDIMPTHSGHMEHAMAEVELKYKLIQNTLLLLPVLFTIAGYMLYKLKIHKQLISVCYTLALTFGSISLISGGGGSVELHFSIFMVIAMCAYYENIKLISLMTAIFTVQHIIGLFWATELVFGVSQYSFGMILIHAIFLVFTSGATIIQILSKRKMVAKIEMAKQQKEVQFNKLLAQTQKLTNKMEATTELVQTKSVVQKQVGEEMAIAFQEVATGLSTQSESIESVNKNLNQIRQLVSQNAEATERLRSRFDQSQEVMNKGQMGIHELTKNIDIVTKTIENTAVTIQQLNDQTEKIDETMDFINQVSDQTRLLSLNASIEAAKAGKEGRGFAVVAAEIRKLSDQSKSATADIYSVLRGITESSEHSLNAIKEGLQNSLSMQDASIHAVNGYMNMSEDQEHMSEMIVNLSTMMQSLNQKAEAIHEEMIQVAAVVEQGTAAMQEVLAAVNEQEAINRDMLMHISNSNELAEQLKREFVKLNS